MGIQVVANLANDYFDYLKGADTPNRKGPTRVTAAGLVSLSEMKSALFIGVALTFLSGSVLFSYGGWLFACLVALALILAFLYTAGPYPLAYLGLGDVFVFIFFGPVAVAAPYYLLTGKWELTPFIIGLAPGALSTALLAVNNLRDIEEDRAAGKKTLVVRFGSRFGKFEALYCITLPEILFIFFFNEHPFAWVITVGMMIASIPFGLMIAKNENPLVYNKLLAGVAFLLFLLTTLFCICWNR